MSKIRIWISFDLGVRGDYENMYTWLDKHDAKECGDNMAGLLYEYSGINSNEDFLEYLKKDIESSIDITPRTRVYVIYKNFEKGTYYGKFLIGGRKAPPWTGFYDKTSNAITEF